MIITNKTFYSLSTQTNVLGYDFDISVSNTTGYLSIGFSGTGVSDNVLSFSLQDGKIFDYDGNFVYGYTTNSPINIKGVTSGDSNIYKINNVITSTSSSRSVSNIGYFYIYPSGLSANISASISGESPEYSISDVNFYDNSLTGTGYFINNGIGSFRIHSGESQSEDVSFLAANTNNVNPSKSGQFTVVKNYEDISAGELNDNSYTSPFIFYTDFGRISENININTTYKVTQLLDSSIATSISGSGITYGNLNWQNYKGGRTYDSSGLSIYYTVIESGIATSGNWLVETGSDDYDTSYFPVSYNGLIDGYSGDIESYGISGVSFRITKLNNNIGNLNFYFNGYEGNLEDVLSGI